MIENQLRRQFQTLSLDEPPLSETTSDILARGRRRLRRHRVATGTVATLGVSAVGIAGATVVLPQADEPGFAAPASSPPAPEVIVPPEPPVVEDTEPDDAVDLPGAPAPDEIYGYPRTRLLMYGLALEHFDPAGEHLGYASAGGTDGIRDDGTLFVTAKLDWTIPGKPGMGMVHVGVTSPGADLSDLAFYFGCDGAYQPCTEREIPGLDGPALVADAGDLEGIRFGIIHERPDGSFVAVAVHDLFGNNSSEPVSDVAIDFDQAVALLADERLVLDPADERLGLDGWFPSERESEAAPASGDL